MEPKSRLQLKYEPAIRGPLQVVTDGRRRVERHNVARSQATSQISVGDEIKVPLVKSSACRCKLATCLEITAVWRLNLSPSSPGRFSESACSASLDRPDHRHSP
jgi:hypothetical protein